MDPMNKKALREKMAALNSEEVKLACETLVWIDPERYIKELGKYVMALKLDMENVASVVSHRQSVKDRVTGEVMETEKALSLEEIKAACETYEPVIFADNADGEEGIQPVDPKKIEVPDFLGLQLPL